MKPQEKMNMFTREELWRIEEKARNAAGAVVNPNWKHALEDLTHAANVLDAHLARSSD